MMVTVSLFIMAVIGYFVTLSIVLSKSQAKHAVTETAAILLLVYGCIIGLLVFMAQYVTEAGLFVYLLAGVVSFSFLLWKIGMLTKKRVHLRFHVVVALVAYILAVLYVTAFMREAGSNNHVQMQLFHWLQDRASVGFGEKAKHVFMNVLMFVPLGVLFPLAWEKTEGMFLAGVSFGTLLSVGIETSQLFRKSGICDIDDMIANALGAVIGGLCVLVFVKIRKRANQ